MYNSEMYWSGTLRLLIIFKSDSANRSSIRGMRCKSAKTSSSDFGGAIAVQLGAIRDTIYWIVKKRLGLHVLAFGKGGALIFCTKSPHADVAVMATLRHAIGRSRNR